MPTTANMSTYRRLAVCRRRRLEPTWIVRRWSSRDEGLHKSPLYIKAGIDDDGRLRLRLHSVLQSTFPQRTPSGDVGRNTGANCRRPDVVRGADGHGKAGRFHGHGWSLYGVPLQRKVSRNARVSDVCQSQPLCRVTDHQPPTDRN